MQKMILNNKIIITGGRQKQDFGFQPSSTFRFGQALVVLVDIVTGQSEIMVEYISPPETCPGYDENSIVFKVGTLNGDSLYLCSETEIMRYSLPGFERINYLSHPLFNDVHHVTTLTNGHLLVANTGLDLVMELNWEGEIFREWDVLGRPLWSSFSKEVDYRKIPSTQPHASHPNFVLEYDSEIWVTRFKQKDVVCLTGGGRVEVGIAGLHDGIVNHLENELILTAVDGHLIIADLLDKKVKRVIDFNKINDNGDVLGWCRGVCLVDQDHVIVGFTRIRRTKIVENIQWVAHTIGGSGYQQSMPTRIAMYDIRKHKLCWEYNLEDYGMNAIFSIHLYNTDN